METNEYTSQNEAHVRPTFLTVICVITFLFSGWSVLWSVKSAINADKDAARSNEQIEKSREKLEDAPQTGSTKFALSMMQETSPSVLRESSVCNIFCCLFTFIGAVMMWNLRKTGFYIYVAGTVLSVASVFIIFGTTSVAYMAGGLGAFFGLIFILMYGANLRYMTR